MRITSHRTAFVVSVALIAAFGHHAGALQETPAASQQARPPEASGQASTTIEFELPEEFSQRTKDGAFVVQGFRAGFFVPGSNNLVHMLDIERKSLELIDGGKARLRLPLPRRSGAASRVVVRLQTITAASLSEWSPPASDVLTLPGGSGAGRAAAEAAAAAATANPPAPGKPPAGTPARKPAAAPEPPAPAVIAPAELAKYPALQTALAPLLGPGCQETDLSGFRRMENVATGIVLSQTLKISFVEICKVAASVDDRPLVAAVQRLKPGTNAESAIRAARRDAQKLLRPAPKK